MPTPVDSARDEAKSLRQKLLARLQDEGSDHADRLAKCGQDLRLVCTCCGNVRTAQTRCDLKWCPTCARALVVRTVQRYETALEEMEWPSFVTWTTTGFLGSAECLREVRRAHTKMRRLRWFKARVKGGIAGFEMTKTRKTWHPHCHGLIDCKWFAPTVAPPRIGMTREQIKRQCRLACEEAAEQWSLCLGGRKSSIKVRRVYAKDDGDIRPALAEVLKYSVQAETLLEIKGEIGPLIDVLDRTRLVVSWGSCYGLGKEREKHAAAPCDQCEARDSWVPEFLVENDVRQHRRGRVGKFSRPQ